MFHCYQYENNENRFPDDLKGLNYPKDEYIFQSKYFESELLIDILNTKELNYSIELFNKFLYLRCERLKKYPSIIYEYKIETVEGMAEYIGLKALEILNIEKYKSKVKEYKDIVLDLDKYFFDIRRYSYFSGTLILLAIEKLKIEINKKVNNKIIMDELFEINLNNSEEFKNIEIVYDKKINNIFNKYIEDINNKINIAKKELINGKSGRYTITGYDPMNMIKIGNEILHKHFVILKDGDGNSIFLKEKVIILIDNENINKVLKYYIKI